MESVTVKSMTSSGTDSTGESKPGNPSSATYDDCAIWQASSDEIEQVGGDPVVTHVNVSLPANAAVHRGDQVIVRGDPYVVVGKPALWHNPFDDSEPGIVAVAKQVI